jgi:hypothetical protein
MRQKTKRQSASAGWRLSEQTDYFLSGVAGAAGVAGSAGFAASPAGAAGAAGAAVAGAAGFCSFFWQAPRAATVASAAIKSAYFFMTSVPFIKIVRDKSYLLGACCPTGAYCSQTAGEKQ